MSDHQAGLVTLPPALQALVTEAAEKLTEGAKCCPGHTLEALIEHGCRAILGRTPPELDRPIASLTVRELGAALGQPDIAAAREAVDRSVLAQQAAAQEAGRILRDLKAISPALSYVRLKTADELRAFIEGAAVALETPRFPLVVISAWVTSDEGEAGSYAPGPTLVTKDAN